MRKLFQHIRRQPKAVRDNYALGFATSFTLVVLMVWLVARPEGGGILAKDSDPSKEKVAPFATLVKQAKEQMAALKNENTEITNRNDSQAAAVTTAVTATSANAGNLVLSQEDIAIAQESLEKSTTTDLVSEDKNYQEVLIATTSASHNNQDTGFSSTTTASTTAE